MLQLLRCKNGWIFAFGLKVMQKKKINLTEDINFFWHFTDQTKLLTVNQGKQSGDQSITATIVKVYMPCKDTTRGPGSVTFRLGVVFLFPLWQEGGDLTMASVPKVLDGQSDSSTGEEVTQPVTAENMEQYMYSFLIISDVYQDETYFHKSMMKEIMLWTLICVCLRKETQQCPQQRQRRRGCKQRRIARGKCIQRVC